MFIAFYLVRSGFYGLIYDGKIAKSDISTCAYMRGNRVESFIGMIYCRIFDAFF